MLDLWIPGPEQIVRLRDSGVGNMGDVGDQTSPARFSLPSVEVDGVEREVLRWVLAGFRCRIQGGTATDATLQLWLYNANRGLGLTGATDGIFDYLLAQWLKVGNNTDSKPNVNHRTDPVRDLFGNYTFDPGDELVFTWANPDAGTKLWSLEVSLAWHTLRPVR